MRAAAILSLALLLALVLAGCSNPKAVKGTVAEAAVLELPDVDVGRGTDFVTVKEPVWKAGYRFTYEEQGAEWRQFLGDGFDGERAHSEDTAWGPMPGLNYTIVNNSTDGFGEAHYYALHQDGFTGERPTLLAIEPENLDPREAYVGTYCGYVGRDCAAYVSVWEEEDPAPPLDFPLKDKEATKREAEWSARPYVPFNAVQVVTRVLGFKEIDGPFGPVQAVHVHQDFVVNFTRVLQDWGDGGSSGLTDLNMTGDVEASRDVYYAPALRNVVLDQAVSSGEYQGSYRRDGKLQTFSEAWRSWSASRLTNVVLEEGEVMSLEELAAMLHSGASHPDPSAVRVQVEALPYDVNVALGESTTVEATLSAGAPPTEIAIEVFDANGDLAASDEGSRLVFTPSQAGPYLAVAYAFDESGELVDQSSQTISAYYEGTLSVDCPLVADGTTACPGMPVPLGPAIAYLNAYATFTDPAAQLDLPGRLVIDQGDGQEVSSDRQGSAAFIWMEYPRKAFDDAEWTLRYEPQAGALVSVDYQLSLWPSYLPAYVYDRAYGQR